MSDFTHFDNDGRSKMVDVSMKNETQRVAIAEGYVYVNQNTFDLIMSGGMKKGDVLTVAQIAGIMGAKKTSEIIPMCHPLLIQGIEVHLNAQLDKLAIRIEAIIKNKGTTGVEMEALTAVSVCALTVYDMCKAVQKDITIGDIRLLHKAGGTHGEYHYG